MKDKNHIRNNKRDKRHVRHSRNDPAYIYENAVRVAIDGYLGERGVISKFFRLVDMCGKPRLLIGGSAGSGKTLLIAKSGLPCGFVYPADHLTGGHDMPGWFFFDRALCIDTSGALADPQRWSDFCRALRKRSFLRRRSVDWLILVVDIRELLSMDQARAGRLAADLRGQTDTLASVTGYEVPLCFIFSKSDKIEGFCELFGDKSSAERVPVIGGLLNDDDLERPPVEAFSMRYGKIYDGLTDLSLLKMISENSVEKNRLLCRFTSEFLLAETRIAEFLSEFFKYPGHVTPRFHGFFFTSGKAEAGAPAAAGRLLGEIIPNAKFRTRKAGAGTPLHRVKKICLHLLFTAILSLAIFSLAGSGLRDALHIRMLEAELSVLLNDEPTLENQYMALEKLRLSYDYLHGCFWSPGRLIFNVDGTRGKIRDAYIAASAQIMVNPAAAQLEASIARRNQGRLGELTTEEHQSLYCDLKTYLLLTGGNKIKVDDAGQVAEVFEFALKRSLSRRYGSLGRRVVGDNINTVIELAADGLYPERADKNIVYAARQRLAAAPRAGAVYGAVMERLGARRSAAALPHITGRSELLRYGGDVNVLYSREGWEQTVFKELTEASKDPFKADWVMGPVKAQADEARLLSELVSLYGDDLSRRWLDFIRNIRVSLPSDIQPLAQGLGRLSSRDSETRRALFAACSLVTRQPDTLSVPHYAPALAAGIRGRISNRLSGSAGGVTHDLPDPFAEARVVFGAIEAFLNGGAFDEYAGALGELAAKLRECDERGGFAPVFASRGGDPLRAASAALDRAYAGMPPAASAALRRVLESPLEITAEIVAKRTGSEIQESWSAEVAGYFNEKLAGRYPLDKNGNDMPWSTFEEFFRPQSGALWRYRDKNLSGLMERTSKGWERVPARSLSLRLALDDGILRAYNRAEKISGSFFDGGGAPRVLEMTFYPFTSTNGAIQILTGDRQLDFRGGLPAMVARPHGGAGDETITLRLITSDKAQEELRFRGEWAMARLFGTAKVERTGSDRYRVSWRMNVRNIYTANITTVVQSGAETLFDESVMRGFVVPDRVLRD